MKKLIQICSLLGLLLAFSFVSAKAQSTQQRFEADIPFEFNIGGKTFEAGKYFLKVSRIPTGKLLSVEDSNKKLLKYAIVNESGAISKNKSQLRFILSENQWVLSNLMTNEAGLSLPLPKAKKQIAQSQAANSSASVETISIDLK